MYQDQDFKLFKKEHGLNTHPSINEDKVISISEYKETSVVFLANHSPGTEDRINRSVYLVTERSPPS